MVEVSALPQGLRSLVRTSSGDSPSKKWISQPPLKWPKDLQEEALSGIAGEFVRLIEPHSEADRVALLVQFLAAIGNLIGRGPYFQIEASKHFTNIFLVLVGSSSKGRKGTSWDHVWSLLRQCDPTWGEERIHSGLSSGEGLVWAIRDAEKDDEGETLVHGVDDKRLLVVEPEFASVLKNCKREGNVLSQILRSAWDGKRLQNMVKKQPGKCAEPHVSIVGHVTKMELLRDLTATETANGFANRFFWACVKRSKLLPLGGEVDPKLMDLLKNRLLETINYSQGVQRMRFTPEAEQDWETLYSRLAIEKPGMLGAILARAEPIILRLSLIYALLDRESAIGRSHLESAIALWEYVEESTKYIFGESTGDRLADRILQIVRHQNGLAQTDLINALGNNFRAEEIERCRVILVESGLVSIVHKPSPESKKPVTRWYAGTETNNEYDEVDG